MVGALLVVSFIVCRIVICTWQGVRFSVELGAFSSDDQAEWAFIVVAYLVYLTALVLSWVWLRTVLTECYLAVRQLCRESAGRRVRPAPSGAHSRTELGGKELGVKSWEAAAPGGKGWESPGKGWELPVVDQA